MKTEDIKWTVLIYLLFTFSCDNIALEDIEQTRVQQPDNRPSRARNVLLEYFTGHTCGNCPGSGGTSVNQLSALYPNQLIVLSVHAGFFARPRPSGQPFQYDFRTPAGNSLDEKFGVSSTGTPKGLVNRAEYNGNKILTPSAWSAAVSSFFSDSAILGIQLKSSHSLNNRSVSVSAEFSAFENIGFPVKIEAFIVEDSIVNWQRDYTKVPEDSPDYIHRFVLRGSMISAGGDQLITTTHTMNDTFPVWEFQSALAEEWKLSRLWAVVMAYSQENGEVLQAQKIKINP